MPSCPECRREMEEVRHAEYFVSRCERCRGHLLSIPVLRRLLPAGVWEPVRERLLRMRTPGTRACPGCRRRLCGPEGFEALGGCGVELCRMCRLVWLDPRPVAVDLGVRAPAGHEAAVSLLGASSFLSRRAFLSAVDAARASLAGRNGSVGPWLAACLR